MQLSAEVAAFINSQRTARLATVGPSERRDESGRYERLSQPHIVPICFALDGDQVYSVLDAKPKRVPVRSLRRVRNLIANPNVQLLFDRWDEDWSRLAYVQLRGVAKVIEAGKEQSRAVALLRERYPQYVVMDVDEAPVIGVAVEGIVSWGKLGT